MKSHKCDILVVGAGPAGSSAAMTAARTGARVLMVERKAVIGTPVRCAEHIPGPLLKEVGLGRRFVVQPVRGMRTLLPGGEIKETRAPGYIIRRDLFDQTLADGARTAGAEILLSAQILRKNGGRIVLKQDGDQYSEIKADIIIGADGPRSTVGRWIGSENSSLIPAVQVRVPLVRDMEFTEVYFDKEFYGGYGWLFPKGDQANVGLGRKKREGNGRPLMDVLGHFVSRLTREGKIKGRILGNTAGWIPAGLLKKTSHENILLVGDAAGQTHAMSGAGVFQAVVCGRMAGKWAATALESGNLCLLSEYEKEWRDMFGGTLERAVKRRELLEKDWDRLDEIIKYCWIAYREYYAGSE